ncbi:MAG TPA: capsule assembly Wzi family protein [Flavisolibacter sp.]|nr:capsule assembly Wzi family protein [Flavisolibacter sp.]
MKPASSFLKVLRYAIALFILARTVPLSAQTVPVGMPVIEERLRRAQLRNGSQDGSSFTIRPIHSTDAMPFDSLVKAAPRRSSTADSLSKGMFHLLPLTINQQFNSHHPYGWNDGSMIQAKGYQGQVSMGIFARVGPLTVQLRPEMVFAANDRFSTFPTSHSDSIWNSYYYVLNRIDDPERYGEGSYTRLLPGQSSIRLNLKKLSFGLSTENLWWGPGIRNSLVMSNTAPGFMHLSFNSNAPVASPIGSFEWQIVSGWLRGSGILPPETDRTFNGQGLYLPKPDGARYLNGMVATWQPKWTKGLFLGLSRVFYQYQADVKSSFNGYFPVGGAFFKGNAEDEGAQGKDQLISLFFRLLLPKEKAELYGEFGRNDHAQRIRDFLLQPEHARAYLLGGRKIFDTKNGGEVELFAEFTHLQNPPTVNVRALEGWYTHYQVRHGYTHLGQVLGAGIGPGGSSQTLGLHWLKENGKWGGMLERVVRNNDFYYSAFTASQDFDNHWVDLSLNLNKNWQKGRLLYDLNLTFIRSLNYQWIEKRDISHVQARAGVSYLF